MGFGGILRQSTAVDVLIGPFVDSTDGDAEETGLTIAQADVRLSKNGQTGAQKNDNTTCAHDADGFYNCELDATDTNTVGQLTLWVHVAGALAVRHDYQVIEEALYDAVYAASATGLLPANVTQWNSSAVATPTVAGVPEVDVTHWIGTAAATPTTAGVPEVDVTFWLGTAAQGASGRPQVDVELWLGSAPNALASGRVDATVGAMQASVMTAAAAASDLTTELQSGLATSAALATVDSNVDAILADTGTDGVVVAAASKTGYALSAAGLADFFDTDSGTTYASAVAGSVVKEIADNAGGASLTVEAIADEVQTRTIAAVTTVGSVSGSVGSVTADVNANLKKINDVTIAGDGAGTPFGP